MPIDLKTRLAGIDLLATVESFVFEVTHFFRKLQEQVSQSLRTIPEQAVIK
ncbi:hypothetical protein [Listeria monocytogenes]|uniref:hypothetical protein n=1 Tax=Listeria monocytogenes TaxID=1639 RepID=UPI003875F6DF